jgi:phenylacetate-coenzyme A ligase PaaK-like adenylate-forming protein
MVRTYASSAVRLIQVAIEKGIDISGNVVFTGAEPLTPRRASFIQSAGVKPLARYVATETGLIGASCKDRDLCDDMHIYLDRHAIIQRRRNTAIGNYAVDSYLFTSLLNTAGKVMFNTELGDFGQLTVRPCSCVFGQLGMNVHVAEVRSYDKLTCEGMTLLGSELDEVVAEIVHDAGGGPDDYQFRETQNESGMPRLLIAVNPDLHALDEKQFVETVLKKLRDKKITLTSQFWEQADTLHLTRAKPEYTRGSKMLPILKK